MPTPLPVHVRPEPGETFPSLVERIAHAHGTSPGWILDASGIEVGIREGTSKIGRFYGVALPDESIDGFARFARLTREVVAGTLLTALHGTCLDFSEYDGTTASSLARHAKTQWATWVGTNFCPHCLADDGVWRLDWRLPWTFACEKHGTLLLAVCTACGFTPDHGTRRIREAPVTELGRCREPMRRGKGRQSPPCGNDLTASPTEIVSESALEAQQRITSARRSAPTTHETPVAFFLDVQAIVQLIVCGLADERMLPQAPSPSAERAMSRFVEHRHQTIREPDGLLTFAWRNRRVAPYDPALMAAMLPLAFDIATSPSSEASRDSLVRFASAVRCELAHASMHQLTKQPVTDKLRSELTTASDFVYKRYHRTAHRPSQLLDLDFTGTSLPAPTRSPQLFSQSTA